VENKNFDICSKCFAKHDEKEGLKVAPALDKDRVASRDFVLKLKLKKGEAVECRRIRVSALFEHGKNLSYDRLMGIAAGFLDGIDKTTLTANSQVTYIDSDGDKINISSDEELNDSFEGILKMLPSVAPFRITVIVGGATAPRRLGCNVSYSPAATLFANQPKTAQGPTAKNALFIHGRHTCDSCSASPIVGTRYHSTKIPDFDLCTKCYDNYEGDKATDFQPEIHDRDLKMQKRWSKRQNRRAAKATGNVAGMWHRTNGDLVEFLKNIQEQTGTLIESAEIIRIPKDEGAKKTEVTDAKAEDVNQAGGRGVKSPVAESENSPKADGANTSFLDDAIETSTKVKDCGPQTFISRLKYRKRMLSPPSECFVLTHWRVLDNGALFVCSQSLSNAEDSVVPLPGDGTSRGYTRSSLRVEGWLATQLPRGSDGMPATNLVYVVEGDFGGRAPWSVAERAEQSQPVQVSRLIRTLTEDPDLLERYANAPPLRNEL